VANSQVAQSGQQSLQTDESLGSGFIIDPSGYIVTNRHVIDRAYEIIVTLQDNTMLKADVVGFCHVVDLALLKVNAMKPLPVVKLGDSDKVRVGDPVLAIGNPLGYGGSVSAGIVSALMRDIHASPVDEFIQTDAAINHGNSGGPLFDMNGDVIGVNTALQTASANGGSIGIGFAIPAMDVTFLVGQLREFGQLHIGWLGLRLQDLTAEIAESLRLEKARGALIVDIDQSAPAANGFLQAGDVVLKFDDYEVPNTRFLNRAIGVSVNKKVALTIWRDGKIVTVKVGIEEWPEEIKWQKEVPMPLRPPAPIVSPDLGLRLVPVNADLRREYELASDTKGVVVTSVAMNSLAAAGGIRQGDVIEKVQNKTVTTPDEVQKNLDQLRQDKRRYALALVRGKNGLRWIALPLDTNW
jgi:serine protease Do